MARIALAYTQPRPAIVTTVRQRGSAPTWTDLIRVPYGHLTSGTSGYYAIVAFGHLGRTYLPGGGTARFALIGLRFDTASTSECLGETLTRIPLHATIYQDGTGANANRAHPWCAVWIVTPGNWPATTDLCVSTTLEYVGGVSAPHGSFYCDETTVLVFDYDRVDNFIHAANSTPAVLPYSDVGEALLIDGPVFPTQERWLAFYGTQVTPATENDPGTPYSVWMGKFDSLVADPTYGLNGLAQITGMTGRVSSGSPPSLPDPLIELYSCGGWYPIDVDTASTKIQVRGRTDAVAATAINRAEFQTGRFFAVKQSAFCDAASDAIAVVPTAFNRNAWVNFRTLNVDSGDDRPATVAIASTTLYDNTQPSIVSAVNLCDFNGGFPASKLPIQALCTTVSESGVDHCPAYCSHVAQVPPWIARHGSNASQVNGLVNLQAGYGADVGGRFYAHFILALSDDPDRTPPTPRVVTYTAITLNSEIDIAVVPQLPADLAPDEGLSVEIESGLTSFTTEDGYVVRWPRWSRGRRVWRFRWLCNEGRYNALFVYLYRPYDSSALRLPAGYVEAPGQIVHVQPSTVRAQQVSGRLVWEVSCVGVELVHTT